MDTVRAHFFQSVIAEAMQQTMHFPLEMMKMVGPRQGLRKHKIALNANEVHVAMAHLQNAIEGQCNRQSMSCWGFAKLWVHNKHCGGKNADHGFTITSYKPSV